MSNTPKVWGAIRNYTDKKHNKSYIQGSFSPYLGQCFIHFEVTLVTGIFFIPFTWAENTEFLFVPGGL